MTYSLPRVPGPQEPIGLLSVSPAEDDHASLRRILGGTNWQVVEVSTSQEAKTVLLARKMPVVICATNLAESSWKALLAETCQLPDPPKLIVSSRLAEGHLWAEALNVGCYDVLATPYAAEEVLRVVCLAWNRWRRDCEGRVARPKPPGSALTDSPSQTRVAGVR